MMTIDELILRVVEIAVRRADVRCSEAEPKGPLPLLAEEIAKIIVERRQIPRSGLLDPVGPRLPRCEECGIYHADPPSKLCPGCQAYREHQQ
jgi:hypothetical protein